MLEIGRHCTIHAHRLPRPEMWALAVGDGRTEKLRTTESGLAVEAGEGFCVMVWPATATSTHSTLMLMRLTVLAVIGVY